jgi:ribosomal protein L29
MRTQTRQLNKKTIQELEKEIINMRQDISKLQLEKKVNPPKDTNTLWKKRKQLAAVLTAMREKQTEQQLKVK